MAQYRVTMSFLMEATSKEAVHALITGALGERQEFLSVMEVGQPASDRQPETGWLAELLRQLTGK